MKHGVECLGLMCLCLVISGCSTTPGTVGSQEYAKAKATAKMVDFKIAGGQTVRCPVTDGGPLPAEAGPYKVEVAGLSMGKDETGENTFLIFTFGVSVRKGGAPSRVTVEDVSDDLATTMIDDTTPQIEEGYWRGNASPLILSEESTPWIFDNKPTIKIFRITIASKDTPDVILYQPSWYAAQTKGQIAQWAKKKS